MFRSYFRGNEEVFPRFGMAPKAFTAAAVGSVRRKLNATKIVKMVAHKNGIFFSIIILQEITLEECAV